MTTSQSVPKIGPTPEGIAAFHDYAQAFSGGDIERFPLFYTEDVIAEWGPSVGVLHGRDAIVETIGHSLERIEETLEIRSVAATDDAVFVEMVDTLTATQDWLDHPVAPLRAGESLSETFIVRYGLEDGRINRITIGFVGDREITTG
jgi:hypothetical protein